MIYIRIELWPGGDRRRARTLGEATIANVGGTAAVGDYEAKLMKSPEYAKRPGVWKKARIEGFPRLRLGPWELLLAALTACIGDRLTRSSTRFEAEPCTMDDSERVMVEALRRPVHGRPEPLALPGLGDTRRQGGEQ